MKERKIPMRRCVGCMESKEKKDLIRIAGYEGSIDVDPTGRAKGRGVYLCRNNEECWKKAFKKKALERSLNMPVSQEQKEQILQRLTELKNADK